ncbi:hypothetical protein [Clostridium thailandense]|nr:hypothetical protein [Clostridium thailandense]
MRKIYLELANAPFRFCPYQLQLYSVALPLSIVYIVFSGMSK